MTARPHPRGPSGNSLCRSADADNDRTYSRSIEACAFVPPMLIAIVVATLTERTIEKRSIYDARLSDE